MILFIRTDEVKKDAIGKPLDFFLKKYSGQTTDDLLTKAYHDIRTRDNTWVMPVEEQRKLVVASKHTTTATSAPKDATNQQIATPSTAVVQPKGAKSARIAALAIEGKSIKETMTIMEKEGNAAVYSQVHQVFKKLDLLKK